MIIEPLKKFILDGSYQEMKSLEKKMGVVKDIIRRALTEKEIGSNRIEWTEHDVVGKFTKINRYEQDHVKLNCFLDNLGILPMVCRVDTKGFSCEQLVGLESFQSKQKKIIRYEPRKLFLNIEDEIGFMGYTLTDEMEINQQVSLWKRLRHELNKLNSEWNRLKVIAVKSHTLIDEKVLEFHFGTIYVDLQIEYNMLKIFEKLGREFLINHCKVKISALDDFLAKGIITKKDISDFRKIVGVSLRFSLMEKRSEDKIHEFLNKRQTRLSQLNNSK